MDEYLSAEFLPDLTSEELKEFESVSDGVHQRYFIVSVIWFKFAHTTNGHTYTLSETTAIHGGSTVIQVSIVGRRSSTSKIYQKGRDHNTGILTANHSTDQIHTKVPYT